jgi:hypothetical protein
VLVMRFAAMFVFSALLAACASDGDARLLAEDPAFSAGYGDGCATAIETDKSFSTRRSRDETAFETDRAYRAGWRQGFAQCRDDRSRNDGGLILGRERERE